MTVVQNAGAKSGLVGLPAPVDTVAAGLVDLIEHGVCLHRGFVAPDMVEALRVRVEEQAEMERRLGVANIGGPGGPEELIDYDPTVDFDPIYQMVEFLPNKGQVLVDQIMSANARGYAEGVFGALPFHLWTSSAIITRRGTAQQRIHRDEGVLPLEMSTRATVINVFIALSDFDIDMGATLIAPGSHLFGTSPFFAGTDGVAFFASEMKAGDAMIWDGRTWHCGGEHRSDKTRTVLSIGYGLSCIAPQHVYAASLQDDVHARLTDAEREMFGLRAEGAGYTNRVAPRSATDSRTNTNRPTPFVPELHRP